MPPRQRGSSKFEFALAALVFAVLVGVGANRLNAYQERLETVAAEQLITGLRTALMLRMSQLTATQRRREIAAIADENPIGWLYEKPRNYLGEYYSPDNEKLASGNWYFDRQTKTLVYLLTRRKSFAPQSSILLRFKVQSFSVQTIPSAAAPSAPIGSVSLVQVVDQ